MKSKRFRSAVHLVVLLTCLIASLARGESVNVAPKVDPYAQRVSQARQFVERGRYAAAIKEFRAAYAIRQSAGLLFNLGVCNQRIEKYSEAIGYYSLYLVKEPYPQEAILKELETLLSQMKAISEEVQSKKQEVLQRLCAFSVGSSRCPKQERLNAAATVPRRASSTQGADGTVATADPGLTSEAGKRSRTQSPLVNEVVLGPNNPTSSQPTEVPLYKKGWFWGVLTGSIVAGTIIIGVGAYAGTRPKNVPDINPTEPVTFSLSVTGPSFP